MSEYVRKFVDVYFNDNVMRTYAYIYNRDLPENSIPINHGDYVKYVIENEIKRNERLGIIYYFIHDKTLEEIFENIFTILSKEKAIYVEKIIRVLTSSGKD